MLSEYVNATLRVLFRVSRQLPLPVVDGRELTIRAVA
jgi:hypothetical protein